MSTICQAISVTPSARQLALQKLEFYAFFHFGMNTFTDREWGDGTEDPALFNPAQLNANQWVQAVKSAGMRAVVLTCKHHDGFCLWPSRHTEHSVKNSPWKGGQGDVVREVSDACRRLGLPFGVYLSPWDRHEKSYGDSAVYNAYYLRQLTELATNYGDIFCFWFDGACGEGPNGKRQEYAWESYYELIRRLQPNATIHVCGPDVRWCGNEAGQGRLSEWSVVPAYLCDNEKISAASQQADDAAFRLRLTSEAQDLGSRDVIANTDALIWYPAEVDTSIRPGWFYHSGEDDAVRPLQELLDIYYGSVGANASLLLNIPPDTRGLVAEADVRRLAELGSCLQTIFGRELCSCAQAHATAQQLGCAAENVLLEEESLYWKTPDGMESAALTLRWDTPQTISHVVLREHLPLSQRIEAFALLADGRTVYSGTVVGYKRIVCLAPIAVKELTVHILESRVAPTLERVEVYYSGFIPCENGNIP